MHFMMFFNPYRNIVRFACRSNHLTKCTSTNHIFQIVLSKDRLQVREKNGGKICRYYMITQRDQHDYHGYGCRGFLAPFQQNRS